MDAKLYDNSFYKKRKETSEHKIQLLKDEMDKKFCSDVTIFVVGSLGREEVGENSDLDLFIFAKKEIPRLEQYKIFVKLQEINEKLGFPEFSNDGQFLNIHTVENLKKHTGSPNDDSENLFTARMLMLLESKVVFNEKLFDEILNDIIQNYLRDSEKNDNFVPFFLLNDILRYWRTLCLNYEAIRHDDERPWRKKNVNLKYSRMLTVFSTVLSLIVTKDITKEKIFSICKKTPLERIIYSLEIINDDSLNKEFDNILNFYKIFLEAKEQTNIEKDVAIKMLLNTNAEKFSDIITSFLNNEKIDKKLRKFLVV
ncbi:DNA polymerase beta domain protein region [Arcobacter nitrofigilis DSM 7299]|uniref:DNA polymerase beta domain protein region n=1 Tax=Arcobacter nitrofigilis (strain ATCC 33309 / DSM 7299 / CCUG 15893 / LMG 7604 / NCTC 12251 / CI) TaxID=572480 RepID=D5V1B8_ARCNC|nr:nucleotidyltransferase domain-containing protein [Arcobacter nitrofigilis]ADG94080.1 DNA polymerase beta domain protein region [Arcobacter nitrofigilis DSM 7299]